MSEIQQDIEQLKIISDAFLNSEEFLAFAVANSYLGAQSESFGMDKLIPTMYEVNPKIQISFFKLYGDNDDYVQSEFDMIIGETLYFNRYRLEDNTDAWIAHFIIEKNMWRKTLDSITKDILKISEKVDLKELDIPKLIIAFPTYDSTEKYIKNKRFQSFIKYIGYDEEIGKNVFKIDLGKSIEFANEFQAR